MSCPDTTPNCNPCAPGQSTKESLASSLDNLIKALFGPVTYTLVNGRAVWQPLCAPNTLGVSCFPKDPDTGFICYFLDLMAEFGTRWQGDWSSGVSYCQNSLARFNGIVYIALSSNVGHQPSLYPLIWAVFVQDGPSGPSGPQGAPGVSGGGSAINYSTLVTSSDYTLTNTDAVIWCTNSSPITITIPLMSSLSTGKWFRIERRGTGNVTIVRSSSNTINGATSFLLDTQYAGALLTSAATGDWAAG